MDNNNNLSLIRTNIIIFKIIIPILFVPQNDVLVVHRLHGKSMENIQIHKKSKIKSNKPFINLLINVNVKVSCECILLLFLCAKEIKS